MARRILERALAIALLVPLLGACSRKAPGPQDCYHFALTVVGVTDARMLRDVRVRAAVDQLTNRCLTTPFDRQLLSCVSQVGDVPRCLEAFKARRSQPRLPGGDERM